MQGHSVSTMASLPADERIMALTWLSLGSDAARQGSGPVFQGSPRRSAEPHSIPHDVVVLGTSTGHLQLHDRTGQLLHRQRLHGTAVCALQACSSNTSTLIRANPSNAAQTLLVTFRDAVCAITVCSIKSVLRHVSLYINLVQSEGVQGSCPPVACSFCRWTMPWTSVARCDTVCIPGHLHLWEDVLSLQTPPQQRPQPALAFVSVGAGPAIARFEARDADDAAVELPAGKVDIGDVKGNSGLLNNIVNGVAGLVMRKPVDAATELLGMPLPGCQSHSASFVKAIVGVCSFNGTCCCIACCCGCTC